MKLKLAREVLLISILSLAIFLLAQSTARHTVVRSFSMEPSLDNGEHVLVNRAVYFHVDRGWATHIIPFLKWEGNAGYLFHAPNRGDIVVLNPPESENTEQEFIKRIIAIPGDTVEIKQREVYVNGQALNEDYIKESPGYTLSLQTIPPDSYFVLGDNRNNSMIHDSSAQCPARTSSVKL